MDGLAASSSWVYGCAGAASSWAVDASSTTKPAYITKMRSQISETTAMSWEMNRMLAPVREHAAGMVLGEGDAGRLAGHFVALARALPYAMEMPDDPALALALPAMRPMRPASTGCQPTG